MYPLWKKQVIKFPNSDFAKSGVKPYLHTNYQRRIKRLIGLLFTMENGSKAGVLMRYHNSLYGFDFQYPADMQVQTSPDSMAVEVSYDPLGPAEPTISGGISLTI